MIMRLIFGPTWRPEAMGFRFIFHHHSVSPPPWLSRTWLWALHQDSPPFDGRVLDGR
jgi:hypothetical protein